VQTPPIAHHKFVVLTHDGAAEAVLTGSTNFSVGGVFGQSNVVHVVNDPQVAADYLQLWTDISANPAHATLKQQLSARNPVPPVPVASTPPSPPVPSLPAPGTTVIFSPQQNLNALAWYAHLAATASDAVFMTFAFGMPALFKEAYRTGSARLRLLLQR
jgi:hypothetical protein